MTWVLQNIVLHKSLPCGCGFVEGIHVVVCPEHGETMKKKRKIKNPVAKAVRQKTGAGPHKDKKKLDNEKEFSDLLIEYFLNEHTKVTDSEF